MDPAKWESYPNPHPDKEWIDPSSALYYSPPASLVCFGSKSSPWMLCGQLFPMISQAVPPYSRFSSHSLWQQGEKPHKSVREKHFIQSQQVCVPIHQSLSLSLPPLSRKSSPSSDLGSTINLYRGSLQNAKEKKVYLRSQRGAPSYLEIAGGSL